MKLLDYFTNGQRNTLKFKDHAALSYKGEPITVYHTVDTVIDRFFVGEFTSVTYNITVEFTSNKKETMQVSVVVRPGQASVLVYGRTGIDDEIITLSGTVNNSYFTLTARATTNIYNGARIIYFANYAETFVPLTIPISRGSLSADPIATVDTDTVKFRPVISNTGFKSPGFSVDSTGTIIVNQLTATSAAIDGDLSVSNGALSVTSGAVQITSATTGTMDNVTIGATTPANATFVAATVTQTPTADMQVANKKYVDSKASALAIALGS